MELSRQFPMRFEFFDLGPVVMSPKPCGLADLSKCPFLVVFRLFGDQNGACAIGFAKLPASGDEESMAIEIANILASKFVTNLSDGTGGMIEISPPEVARQGEGRHRYLTANFLCEPPTALSGRGGSGEEHAVKRYDHSGRKIWLAYLPSRGGLT
jgi:hypothetical protein